MKLEQTRLFLGNLPSETTEKEICKKLKKYGQVKQVEVRHRKDSDGRIVSTFAFIDVETDKEKINSCLNTVPFKDWGGHQVKLEIAKESFLSRLQKERQGLIQGKQQNSSGQHDFKRTSDCNDTTVEKLNNSLYLNNASKIKYGSSDDNEEDEKFSRNNKYRKTVSFASDSEDSESGIRGKLRMFRGTEAAIGAKNSPRTKKERHYNSEGARDDYTMNAGTHDIENSLLKKFESFSDVWKDDSPSSFGRKSFSHESRTSKPDVFRENLDTRDWPTPSDEKPLYKRKGEEKRLKSLEERRQALQEKQAVIKSALSSLDSNKTSRNRKIIFDWDEEEAVDNSEAMVLNEPEDTSDKNPAKSLFEEDSDEVSEDDFRIKNQFEGKKGQKLLELQSRYANDKRFVLDERFMESDEDNQNKSEKEENKPITQNGGVEQEKKMQFDILQSVLGQEITPVTQEKTPKSRALPMLRFDPSVPEHAKYEIKPEIPEPSSAEKTTKKEKRKKKQEAAQVEENRAPTATQDRFYDVSENLVFALKDKTESENTQGFSLLKMFGTAEKERDSDDAYETKELKKQNTDWLRNPFRYDSSDTEDDESANNKDMLDKSEKVETESKEISNNIGNQNWIHETFFFKPKDERFEEGWQFFSEKRDLCEIEKKFPEVRTQLKLIFRARLQNARRKNRPFKRKLGGMKHKRRNKMNKK